MEKQKRDDDVIENVCISSSSTWPCPYFLRQGADKRDDIFKPTYLNNKINHIGWPKSLATQTSGKGVEYFWYKLNGYWYRTTAISLLKCHQLYFCFSNRRATIKCKEKTNQKFIGVQNRSLSTVIPRWGQTTLLDGTLFPQSPTTLWPCGILMA